LKSEPVPLTVAVPATSPVFGLPFVVIAIDTEAPLASASPKLQETVVVPLQTAAGAGVTAKPVAENLTATER
jgi:hypothetical protein